MKTTKEICAMLELPFIKMTGYFLYKLLYVYKEAIDNVTIRVCALYKIWIGIPDFYTIPVKDYKGKSGFISTLAPRINIRGAI